MLFRISSRRAFVSFSFFNLRIPRLSRRTLSLLRHTSLVKESLTKSKISPARATFRIRLFHSIRFYLDGMN